MPCAVFHVRPLALIDIHCFRKGGCFGVGVKEWEGIPIDLYFPFKITTVVQLNYTLVPEQSLIYLAKYSLKDRGSWKEQHRATTHTRISLKILNQNKKETCAKNGSSPRLQIQKGTKGREIKYIEYQLKFKIYTEKLQNISWQCRVHYFRPWLASPKA